MVPPHLCPASLDPLKQQSELDLKIPIFFKKRKMEPQKKKGGKKKKYPTAPSNTPKTGTTEPTVPQQRSSTAVSSESGT